MAPIEIREASANDAEEACMVLRRSIVELCIADHGNDSTILQSWLANKRLEVFKSWLSASGNIVLLAIDSERIVAVGSVNADGVIGLNYVLPEARFKGVSRALLKALEARAFASGNRTARLNSTKTARQFYRARGYVDAGPPLHEFGTDSCFPMLKQLDGSAGD